MKIENLAADAQQFTSNVWCINNTALIDVGTDRVVFDHLRKTELEAVVITHSHFDHIENLPKIVEQFDPTVYAFEPDNLPVAATGVADNDTITLAGEPFRVIHAPGHRDDLICLYHENKRVLFSGDLVFPNGYWGRTDLKQGDHALLLESLERVAALAVEQLYAGHDAAVRENAGEHIQQALENAKAQKQPDR